MAEAKAKAKTAVAKPAVKASETSVAAAAKEEKKTETKKAAETKKTTTAAAAKKAPAKKTETSTKTTTTKKAEVKATVNFQFAGKSYTTDDLVKIAKDVWVYDLNKDLDDFKSVELYVKPEESVAYYVINEEVTGSFGI